MLPTCGRRCLQPWLNTGPSLNLDKNWTFLVLHFFKYISMELLFIPFKKYFFLCHKMFNYFDLRLIAEYKIIPLDKSMCCFSCHSTASFVVSQTSGCFNDGTTFNVNNCRSDNSQKPVERARSEEEDSQLLLTVGVFFLQESAGTPCISTRTKGSRPLPLLLTGRLAPLITWGSMGRKFCWL